ncbi:MAG: PRC-barrel domain-containing protein [Thiobacillus sp.]
MFGARTFPGDEVYNQSEDWLGTLKKFMLDLHSDRSCYAVVSCGGVMDVGEKRFAIPWRALTLDAE